MSEVKQKDAEEAIKIAEDKGLVCFIAQSNELMLDVDTPYKVGVYRANSKILDVLSDNNICKVLEVIKTKSQNGNTHIYMLLDRDISEEWRILIQTALGSDPVREILSRIRVKMESTAPTVLFETKAQANRVATWWVNNKSRI